MQTVSQTKQGPLPLFVPVVCLLPALHCTLQGQTRIRIRIRIRPGRSASQGPGEPEPRASQARELKAVNNPVQQNSAPLLHHHHHHHYSGHLSSICTSLALAKLPSQAIRGEDGGRHSINGHSLCFALTHWLWLAFGRFDCPFVRSFVNLFCPASLFARSTAIFNAVFPSSLHYHNLNSHTYLKVAIPCRGYNCFAFTFRELHLVAFECAMSCLQPHKTEN